MHHRSGLTGVLYIAVIGAVVGYFFRATAAAGGSAIPLAAFSVIMTLVYLLAAVSLDKEPVFAEVYRASAGDTAASVLGAMAIAIGCAISLPRHGSALTLMMFARGASCLLGILGAAGLFAAAVVRARGGKPMAFLHVFITLYYIVRLFLDFRGWMLDPKISDYCYHLFALISFMISSYHAGAYCFDRGARRRLTFFSLTGVLFGAVTLVGANLAGMLISGGSMLWMLACAGQMMRRK